MTRVFAWVLMPALLAVVHSGCGKSIPPDLEQAKDVFSHLLAPMNMERSMFPVAYPECKPSQYVRYIFSQMGGMELPPLQSRTPPEEKEMLAQIGMPLWPDGVGMSANTPDRAKGRQVVLRHNDARNLIIVELYEDPAGPPRATYEWPMTRVTPSERSRVVFETHVEQGVKY